MLAGSYAAFSVAEYCSLTNTHFYWGFLSLSFLLSDFLLSPADTLLRYSAIRKDILASYLRNVDTAPAAAEALYVCLLLGLFFLNLTADEGAGQTLTKPQKQSVR